MDIKINLTGRSAEALAALAKTKRTNTLTVITALLEQVCDRPGLSQALLTPLDLSTYVKPRMRRSAERFPFHGKQRTIAEISNIIGVPRETLRARVNAGWPLNRAFSPERDTRGRKTK